jgi:hypothetical protein
MQVYLFHRSHKGVPFFYPVELVDDADAVNNAVHNPGTVKVTDVDGNLIWPKPEHKN